MPNILDFKKACHTTLSHCNSEYAKSYARHGLKCYTENEMRVQALYILCNINDWRGTAANEVRGVLKAISQREG